MTEPTLEQELANARKQAGMEPVPANITEEPEGDSVVEDSDNEIVEESKLDEDDSSDDESESLNEGGRAVLQKERKLRREAEKAAKAAAAEADAKLEEFKKQIQEMLGVKLENKEDSEKDYAAIAAQAEERAKAAERKVLLTRYHGNGHLERMENHLGLQKDLAEVDPDADDAASQVKAIVKKWTTKESYLRKLSSTGIDFKGGQESSSSGVKTLEQELAEARRRAGI